MTRATRMKTPFSARQASKAWSSAELQQLRALAHEAVPVDAIAARLRRSVSAIRNKAGMHGISLASTPRSGVSPRAFDPRTSTPMEFS